MVAGAIFLIFPMGLALAAISDLFTMTIPNRVSVMLFLSFIFVAPFIGLDWHTLGMNLAGGLIVFSICFALFALNIMGGGDAKLLSVSAIWFGFNVSLALFILSVAVVGGLLTVAILMLRSHSQEIMASGLPIPDSLLVAKKIPYGIAIAIGGLLTYPEAPIVQLAMQHML
ncbi:A24 family peptidase [Agrobacterium rosae]|uniref:Peptidase n=1 Tax=Agrobacterium rosae TaxID=1972867 RepID=A0AAE5S1P9_9HYPH|nr:prepilin peptidase [Agrobacterium rosae]KAA3510977.1 peptidase [Agrobacterium rosae]KAA3518015.1 peptidase [Agrobacterium rosae]MCM2434303.1 peptidase [Agrobacterium rosae]MDX8329429.1 prepilin peptidase [Agrobacterium rosae]MQB49584.1 peptidase [Agrobacterium rosae]